MRFRLSPVQMMYQLGTRPKADAAFDYRTPLDLVGVPCHAYYEFASQHIDAKRLQWAWSAVIQAHPMLRAKYSSEGFGEFGDEAYSQRVAVFDLSAFSPKRTADELLTIREKLEGRITRHEEGQVVGLALAVLDELNAVVMFDASLVACDVRSIHTVLQELHDLYQGTLDPKDIHDLNPESLNQLIENRFAAPNRENETFWKRTLPKMQTETPCLENFAYNIDNAVLAEHRYRSLNVLLQGTQAAGFRKQAEACGISPYALLLAYAAEALCTWMELRSFVALVPVFNDPAKGESLSIVGDFTDLGAIQVVRDNDIERMARSIDEDLRAATRHACRCTKVVQDELAAHHISPLIVFTMVPGTNIVGSAAKPSLGYLSYSCSQTPQVALDIQVEDFGEGYLVHWVFPNGLFDETELEECVERFQTACTAFER